MGELQALLVAGGHGERHLGVGAIDGPAALAPPIDQAGVVVVNNAAQVPESVLARVDRLISIEWELDGRFVPTLRSRIEHVLAGRSDDGPSVDHHQEDVA